MQSAAALAVPDVWRVQDLAPPACALPSGHEALDAHLPGGGWPVGSLIELIQARPQAHVWQLGLPALAQLTREQPGPIALVGAPHPPFGPALAAQGLPADRLLWIRTDAAAARLWAAEQALRCADVAGLLAWLPQVRPQDLRRLHLAAGRHRKLLFVLRGLDAQQQASPAPLRLRLDGVDELQLRILKRRGPPLEEPIVLPALPARLQALLASRQHRGAPAPVPPPEHRRSHVLDRLVTAGP